MPFRAVRLLSTHYDYSIRKETCPDLPALRVSTWGRVPFSRRGSHCRIDSGVLIGRGPGVSDSVEG